MERKKAGSGFKMKSPIKKMKAAKRKALGEGIAGLGAAIGDAISGAASNIDTSVNKERA